MNVVHIITTIDRGGAEIQLLTLVREQIRQKIGVEILFLKGQSELRKDFEELGATVYDFRDLNLAGKILFFRKRNRDNEFLFHAHLPRSELVCTALARRGHFLVTRHNAEQFYPNAPRFISIILSRFVSNRAYKVIAISSAVADFLFENKEVKQIQKIEIVKYAYRFDLDVEYRRNRPRRVSESVCKIVSIGRLVPQKDYLTLLHGFQIALKFVPHLHLIIIGIGPLEKDLKTLAHKLGILDRIEWLGKQSNVKHHLATADIFVLTSKYEGFGLVLLEAISVGVPIISTKFSAAYEVLGEDFPGLVNIGDAVAVAEKIVDLQSVVNVDLYDKYIRKLQNRFSVEEMNNDLMNLYLSLLGQK